ncbi:MAG TPA: type II toxin-antitoxin system RelE/ParE family toxin [Candidatus Acidoferrales bacterium]|nr:type II toxin-antitoxin system RelE/ParE family toxin [Candidatus Acidoferrales bacterium]
MSSAEKKWWSVVLTAPAQRSLNRIDERDSRRILTALDAMTANPFAGDVKKLQGGLEGYRRRVGNWRVFFDVITSASRVVVTAIERRTTTTY